MMQLIAFPGLADPRGFCDEYWGQTMAGDGIVCPAAEGELLHMGLVPSAPILELSIPVGTLIIGEAWGNPSLMRSHHEHLRRAGRDADVKSTVSFSGELLSEYGAANARDFITPAMTLGLIAHWPYNGFNLRSTYLKARSQLPEYIEGLGGQLVFEINDGLVAMEIWESQADHEAVMKHPINPGLNMPAPATIVTAEVLSLGVPDHNTQYLAES